MKQYTLNKRKEIVAFMEKQLAKGYKITKCVRRATNYFQCSPNTVWNFWNNKDNLLPKSRKPHFCPWQHTPEEHQNIVKCIAEHSQLGLAQIMGILRKDYGYKRHYMSLVKYCHKHDIFYEPSPPKEHSTPHHYFTPTLYGIKWQLDVKYVPLECCKGKARGIRHYQYSMVDEATRIVFKYGYDEFGAKNTCDFIKKSLLYYGYKPLCIQTDRGGEFTSNGGRYGKKDSIHAVDELLRKLNIHHKLNRSYTPQHNGKVERTHDNDNRWLYNHLTFETLAELNKALVDHIYFTNNAVSRAITSRHNQKYWLTPFEKLQETKEFVRELKSENKFKKYVRHEMRRVFKNVDLVA
ncbi:MAG: DDE-type integrase/transposase/recombinase [Christensenellaceae bacterium]|jgi:transposase InsO family protein|nr:DDE-type integrase/transposase/recombinase [Christensenellaceae bacterium]